MKDFLLNPVISIIISQIVVIWSLVVSHYSGKKIAKYLTIFAAIPLTIYALFIGVNQLKSSKDSSQHINSLIERIEKKVINAENELNSINADIKNVSVSIKNLDYIVKDVGEITAVTKNLKTSLSTLNTDLKNVSTGVKDLSRELVQAQTNLAEEFTKQISLFTRQTGKSLQEVQSSTNNTVKAMHQLDQRYMQIIQSLENQRAEIAANFQKEMLQRQQQFLMNQSQEMMRQNQNMLNNMMRFPRY
jgi:chromosome segregation ATPase